MIDINLIRENPEWVKEQLFKRMDTVCFEELLKLDFDKRKLQRQNEDLRAMRNKRSMEIAQLKSAKAAEIQVEAIINLMVKVGEKIAKTDKKINKLEDRIFTILSALPNIPSPEVIPGGKESNRAVKTFGTKPEFTFTPKDHIELCTKLGLIDYERGAKMSGSGTWVYTGMGARLEWALLNYFVDFHIANGYEFIMPPHLLNYESGYAAGQFPKFDDDVFFTNYHKDHKQSRFLLPTSETALINMFRNETIDADKLPIKYFAYSPCYRKEAGGYGSSERGMIRGHQFNKIEMFIFCRSDESAILFNELVSNAEKLVEGLGLHYQTMALAAKDCSSGMAKTYDVELWIPSMNGYKECSSISNATDFQARRANIKTKLMDHVCDGDGCKIVKTTPFVHTLNASGLATSRLLPAIVEQFQNADGTVNVPSALQKYLGGMKLIK
ncbi:MAG: serine--tRNA ligase [Firmicutes bacterium]|nr:serine--tRNA ligase [Bacillota bacterium]